LTEVEYEAWFDKYLGNVESLDKVDIDKSPLSRIPKPLKRKKWIIVAVFGLLICLVGSCLLSWVYEITCFWLWNWISNALLSFSLGIVASLLIMIYTNAKERNVAFYSDIIPILEDRCENMRKAYFSCFFKVDRYFSAKDYNKCFDAWHANCNTCFVILDFLRYLHAVLPFQPKSLTASLNDIEKAIDVLSEANQRISREFFDSNEIRRETLDFCRRTTEYGHRGLLIVENMIQEFKCNLYGIKYGKASKAVDNDDKDI
jgi:hypothetical protein